MTPCGQSGHQWSPLFFQLTQPSLKRSLSLSNSYLEIFLQKDFPLFWKMKCLKWQSPLTLRFTACSCMNASIHVSTHTCIYAFIHPIICLSNQPFIHSSLSVFLSTHSYPPIHSPSIHSFNLLPIPSFMFITPTFTYPPIHLSIYPSTSHPPTHTFIYLVVLRCLGLNSRPYAHHQIRSSTTELHPRPRKVFFFLVIVFSHHTK